MSVFDILLSNNEIFDKILNSMHKFITKIVMISKMISILVLVLMTTSIDCQTSDSICSFIFKDGRVRDLGVYQFEDKQGNTSYRLFNRAIDEDFQKKTEEYELGFKDCNKKDECIVWAQPSPILGDHGIHKFFAGYDKPDTKTCNGPLPVPYNTPVS